LTARNKLASITVIKTPLARTRAHNPHTSGAEIEIYWGFEGVLLMGEVSRTPCPISNNYTPTTDWQDPVRQVPTERRIADEDDFVKSS